MKIIALIADDNAPAGREEKYDALRHDFTLEEAQARMEKMVAAYNRNLRPGELPRRLVSVQIRQMTAKEAYGLGWQAMEAEEDIEENYFPVGHPLRLEWRAGYKDAEEAWVDSEEEEDGE